MKTIEISGIIEIGDGRVDRILLIQQDGLKIDLVNRIAEAIESFGDSGVQLNYWISNNRKTKEQMVEDLFKRFYGDASAGYESEMCQGSSWTGSWSTHYVDLRIGGHNLYDEIKNMEGKFILIELNFQL